MNQNAPDNYIETTESSVQDTAQFIQQVSDLFHSVVSSPTDCFLITLQCFWIVVVVTALHICLFYPVPHDRYWDKTTTFWHLWLLLGQRNLLDFVFSFCLCRLCTFAVDPFWFTCWLVLLNEQFCPVMHKCSAQTAWNNCQRTQSTSADSHLRKSGWGALNTVKPERPGFGCLVL